MSGSFELNNNTENNFLNYNGKMLFKSNNKLQQAIYDKLLSIFDTNKSGCLEGDEIKNIWEQLKNVNSNKNQNLEETEIANFIKNNKMLSALKIKTSDIVNFLNTINRTIENKKSKEAKKLHFDEKDYSVENLKKKYPNCIVQKSSNDNDNYIMVIGNSGPILTIRFHKDGTKEINNPQNKTLTKYDKKNNITYEKIHNKKGIYEKYYDNGKVYSEATQNGSVIKSPIAEAINRDICAKTKLGLPTTGKDIEKRIKQITSNNVFKLLDDYKELYGETLYDAIESEWGMDNKVKERIMKHINNCIIASDKWQAEKPNCKIDKDFHQGNIGDCWLIASICAIAANKDGLKILNNCIKKNDDGSYTVKFKGSKESFNVTPMEIYSRDYSTGDMDVRILELAAEKYFNITGIDGGRPASALELLLGSNELLRNYAQTFNPIQDSKEKLQKLIKDPNVVVTAGTKKPLTELFHESKKSYNDKLPTGHGFAVLDIDNEYVYLKDPNKSDTLRITIEEFQEKFDNIEYAHVVNKD